MSLAGKIVLVTRPRHQCGEIQSLLEQEGVTVVFQPVIEILPVQDRTVVERYITGLTLFSSTEEESCKFFGIRPGGVPFDWLIFSSANGVDFFLKYWEKSESHSRPGPRVRIAAMGPGTASALVRHGLHVDAIPEHHHAEGMAERLRTEATNGCRFLSIRGDRGRNVLAAELTRWGGMVEELTVYRSVDLTEPSDEVKQLLESGRIDAVTVTSTSIARSLVRMFGDRLGNTRLVTISGLTTEALRESGFTVSCEASEADIPALVEAVVRLLKQ